MTSADLAAWLLTYALHSTLLLGVVWLVTSRGLVRSHYVQDLFWKAALVGGIVTATAQSAVRGSWTAAFTLPVATTTAALIESTPRVSTAPAAASNGEMVERSHSPAPFTSPAADAAVHEIGEGAASAPFSSLPIERLLLVGWALIAVAALARLGIAHIRLARRLGDRTPLGPSPLRALLESLCEAAGVRRPIQLTSSDGLASPVALGRSEICVPSAVITDLDAPQQCSVLAHELAHLTRHDPLWLTAASVVERVFFFQPLNRVARRRMQDAAEYLCDDWAVQRTGSGMTMAKSLMRVAEWMQGAPSPVAVSGMAENPSQLLSRVRRLVENRVAPPPRRAWPLIGAAALLVLTAAAVPGVEAPANQSQDPAPMPRPDPRSSLQPMAYPEPKPYPGALIDASQAAKAAIAGIDLDRLASAALAKVDVDAAVAEAVAQTIDGDESGEVSDTVGVDALIQALRDSDAGVRRAAAHSLGNLEARRAVPGLMAVLKDSDTEVRKSAAWALGEIQDRQAASALAGALRDESVEVRKSAAWALGELDLEVAPAELIQAMRDSNTEVRKTAVWAVSEIGDPRAVPDLKALIDDPSPEVRKQAVHALGEIRNGAALQALVAAMDSKDAEVRRHAAAALGER